MTTPTHEPRDTMVITCRVPCTNLERLSFQVVDHTVNVTGPGGFRHRLGLPPEADMDRLDFEVFKGILEVRAPRVFCRADLTSPAPARRPAAGACGKPEA